MSSKILNAQLNDNQCGNMLKNGINTVNKQRGFTERNSVIRKASRIFMPKNNELRNYLLKQFHDNSGHVDREKQLTYFHVIFIGAIFLMLTNMFFLPSLSTE